MKKLTVFTPSFNRAFCLDQLYFSLLSQTSKDFIWLIVDDGSIDKTQDLVDTWIKEDKIKIRYIYQSNKGMVAAHNTALYQIETELAVCIDSDDYMPSGAVKSILDLWERNGGDEYGGLVGLDSYKNGNIIGSKFPEDVKCATFTEIGSKYNVTGDKKYVLRSDLMKKHLPYPAVQGEKFPAPSYLYLFFEKQFPFLLFNEVFCIVEYLPDGNSNNKINHYKNSPKSFALYRIAKMKSSLYYRDRFKHAIHYVSSSILAKDSKFLMNSPFRLTTLLALPFGILLYFYIKNTKRKTVNKNLNKK